MIYWVLYFFKSTFQQINKIRAYQNGPIYSVVLLYKFHSSYLVIGNHKHLWCRQVNFLVTLLKPCAIKIEYQITCMVCIFFT
jgi:hypothetical protein